jgi:hypothetical protein
MSKKIAAVDKQAMDTLYQEDFSRVAAAAGLKDLNGAPEDPQAFKDHEEYISTVENVLAEDKKDSFEPNDTVLD